MENCELKRIDKNKIGKINGKRIAFFVPDVNRKLNSGYQKNAPKVEMHLEAPVNNTPDTFNNVQLMPNNMSQNNNQQQPLNNADQYSNAMEKNNMAPINNGMQMNTLNEKSYILINNYSETKKIDGATTGSQARKLLISSTFLDKLVSNRRAKLVNDVVNKTTMPEETKVVAPAVENIVPIQTEEKNPVSEYADMYCERLEYVKKVKELEEKMIKTAKENRLTEEMVKREIESRLSREEVKARVA